MVAPCARARRVVYSAFVRFRVSLVAVSSLAACALFPDVGGLDTGDASPNDASHDAMIDGADGAITSEASGDFCTAQSAYRLCSDFDQSGGVTQGFDIGLVAVPNGQGGTFTLDTNDFVSSPNGALGVANPFGAGQVSGTRIIGTLWPLGATPASLDCQAQWKPLALSTTANDYAHVVAVSFYSDAQENDQFASLNLNMQGDGTLVLLEYGPKTAQFNVPITVTTSSGWLPVYLSVTFGSTLTYSIEVNGASTGSHPFVNTMPSTSHAEFEVGPAYFGGSTTTQSPGWTFAYDNVVCR